MAVHEHIDATISGCSGLALNTKYLRESAAVRVDESDCMRQTTEPRYRMTS